ncbi:pyruvate kinase [Parafrankia elaeagni]|uniref:pyruvate kinase n=1 Tax=Parafrankia elaeagni TaxID=222534 RepID=UPI001E5B2D53|nr:pyruvate kinase [Parafrankia elaeagni]
MKGGAGVTAASETRRDERTEPAGERADQADRPGDEAGELLLDELTGILADLRRAERARSADVEGVHPRHRPSARNMVHYLALRGRDLRPVQEALARRGLSSLGRCEPCVEATVRAVVDVLHGQLRPGSSAESAEAVEGDRVPTYDEGWDRIEANAGELLGPPPARHGVRIMVTLPSEAATDAALVHRLVARGMNVARINTAHDGPREWRAMAAHVRAAAEELGRTCLVSVDLAGPKVRTGPLDPGPQVVRLRPVRDLRGAAVTPATAELVAVPDGEHEVVDAPVADSRDGVVRVPVLGAGDWLARVQVGDELTLRDARSSRRRLRVVAVGSGPASTGSEDAGESSAGGEDADRTEYPTITVEAWKTTCLETGLELRHGDERCTVGPLPHRAPHHLVRQGDVLRLTRDLSPRAARPGGTGPDDPAGPASMGCTFPAVFDAVRPQDPVSLDDGKIAGVVEAVDPEGIDVRVLRASGRGGAKLRADKGVNLPGTRLPHEGLTGDDRDALSVAVEMADLVAISFVRGAVDVEQALEAISAAGRGDDLGLILKIETTEGFANLPDLLLAALRAPLAGVMIARGDLAVEGGYQRLAELQEEILWLATAAHVPTIWATEVLDTLAKTGTPARAEITDAAMGQRAECVMLNKGPHIDEAITALDDILGRMAGHQQKKTPLLRPLRSWRGRGRGRG